MNTSREWTLRVLYVAVGFCIGAYLDLYGAF